MQIIIKKSSPTLNIKYVKSVRIRSHSGPHFLAFGLNTGRYEVSLRIRSECEKMQTRINRNRDTFYAVILFHQIDLDLRCRSIKVIFTLKAHTLRGDLILQLRELESEVENFSLQFHIYEIPYIKRLQNIYYHHSSNIFSGVQQWVLQGIKSFSYLKRIVLPSQILAQRGIPETFAYMHYS